MPENVEAPTELVPDKVPIKTSANKRKNWVENYNVKKQIKVDTINRLNIIVGVNEYKGQINVFMAKVTEGDFCKQFTALPAYIWEKTIPALQEVIPEVAEVERAVMTEKAKKELKRLDELGVDVKALLKSFK